MAAVTHEIISIIASALGPVLRAIGPVFGWLAELLRGVALAVLFILKGLGDVWNGIVGAVSSLLRSIADFEIFGRHPFGALNSWADSVDEATISMRDLEGKIHDLQNATIPDLDDSTEDTSTGLEEVAAAAEKATSEILNAPQGFKIAAARFGAISGEPIASEFSAPKSLSDAVKDSVVAPVNVDTVLVQANDPAELAAQIQRLQEYEDFRLTGTITSTSPSPVRRSAR